MGPSGRRASYLKVTLKELYERQEKQTSQNQYDVEVEDFLHDCLKEFNDRDVEIINTHLDTINKALSKETDGTLDLMFGGSVSKHTYVNGISDVDMLVLLNDTSLVGKTPKEVLKYFGEMLNSRLPKSEINTGDLAATVTFSDGHEIQLLPAIKTPKGYRIISSDGERWSKVVSPQRFGKELTKVNKEQSGKVVPAIKIIKTMNEGLPQKSRLTGYHIESLAIEIFENYSGTQNYRHMVKHFFQQAKSRIKYPIKDSTGQSMYVDDYLGESGSLKRKRVQNALKRVAERLDQADNAYNTQIWEDLIGL